MVSTTNWWGWGTYIRGIPSAVVAVRQAWPFLVWQERASLTSSRWVVIGGAREDVAYASEMDR